MYHMNIAPGEKKKKILKNSFYSVQGVDILTWVTDLYND